MVTDTKVRDIILEIVEKIKKDYQPNSIILFGSYTYGRPDGDSDIDLLIIKETQDRPIDRRVTVRRIVSDPQRFIPFDSLVLTPGELQQRLECGDQFLREVLEQGEVLYAA